MLVEPISYPCICNHLWLFDPEVQWLKTHACERAGYQILGPKTKLFDPIIQKSQDNRIKFSSYKRDISIISQNPLCNNKTNMCDDTSRWNKKLYQSLYMMLISLFHFTV